MQSPVYDQVADASLGFMQVYVMTRNFRFCTLTLDAYDSSRQDGSASKLNGDVPYQHDGKADSTAALKTEELEGADEGGCDSSLATSVHSSAPALPAAGDSYGVLAAPDAAHRANSASTANGVGHDLHKSIDGVGTSVKRGQQQHSSGVSVPDAAAHGMQQVVIRKDDSTGSMPAASYLGHSSGASVPNQTAIASRMSSQSPDMQSSSGAPLDSGSSATHVSGAGSAGIGRRPADPTHVEAADVTPAVAPSEGFQTSTAVREHRGVDDDRGAGTAVAGSVVVHAEGAAGPGPDPDRGQEKAVILREPARFAALKTRSLWRQLASAEAIGLTLFFTAHVLILQLYLGALPTLACL